MVKRKQRLESEWLWDHIINNKKNQKTKGGAMK